MTAVARRPPAALSHLLVEPVVRAALLEDLGLGGDLTTDAVVDEGAHARGALVAREGGVLAGLDAALLAFRLIDPGVRCDAFFQDGARLAPGAAIATLAGSARGLLTAERTALNLLSHLSGIATATAAYVAAVAGSHASIVETRKTLPGLRALQKYAVRAGGGSNHRLRLDDAVLIKDNHIAVAGGIGPAVRAARARAGHLVKIEVEVETLDQLRELLALEPGADAAVLDNMPPERMREAVRLTGGRLLLEASGSVTLATVAEIAATGVDLISVGALTHSVVALDIGLDLESS